MKRIEKQLLIRIILWASGIILIFASHVFWVNLVGLAVFCGPFFLPPIRQVQQINTTSNLRLLAVYLTILTVGVLLMLSSVLWLIFLGLGLVILANFFSSRRPTTERTVTALFICFIGAIWFLLRSKNIFERTSFEFWYSIPLVAAWLWSAISEYFHWRKMSINRSQSVN